MEKNVVKKLKIPSYFVENTNIFGTLAINYWNRRKEEHSIKLEFFFLKHKKIKKKIISWFKSSKEK